MLGRIRSNLGWIVVVLLMLGLVFFLALQSVLLMSFFSAGAGGGFTSLRGDKIGVLDLSGAIMDVEKSLRILERYEDNDSIKAVLIQVDSPGGAVGPSQELSEAVDRLSEADKPVIASIRSVGASGAYYVSSSADTIVANPGSIVGSIGVIMQFMNVTELADKVGIDYEIVKSGEFKDLGSPFREMNPRERELLQSLIMDVYDQFITHVADQRVELTKERLRALADGRVFTGQQALENGLIDVVGTRDDAVKIAARAAGIPGEPALVNFEKDRFVVGGVARALVKRVESLLSHQPSRFRILYMMPDWGVTR